jgi:effector-binding domain-containing protein
LSPAHVDPSSGYRYYRQDRTYGSLGRHVAEHALQVRTPVREYYLVGAHHTEDRRAWQTEIAWPIQRTPPR